jgi:VWFA-related protein
MQAVLKPVIVALAIAGVGGVLGVGAGVKGQGVSPPPQTPQAPPIFRAQANAVSVDVGVRDKTRRPIGDLTAADFVVEDNGVRQSIDEVTFGKRPIDVTVGLDVSGSVTGAALQRLREGVAELARGLRDVDRVKLVVFNTQVHRVIDFSSDVQAVSRAMRNVPAGGATALFDTLGAQLVAARDAERRQLIVFFTDGADSGSLTSPQVMQTMAVRARATVTFVTASQTFTSMVPGGSMSTIRNVRLLSPTSVLATVARDTGGDVVPIDFNTSLGTVFRKILDDFRSSYVLFYSPSGVDRSGFHTITVEVARPGAVVTARRGYFGG